MSENGLTDRHKRGARILAAIGDTLSPGSALWLIEDVTFRGPFIENGCEMMYVAHSKLGKRRYRCDYALHAYDMVSRAL